MASRAWQVQNERSLKSKIIEHLIAEFQISREVCLFDKVPCYELAGDLPNQCDQPLS